MTVHLLPQRAQRRIVQRAQRIPDSLRRRRAEVVIGAGVLRRSREADRAQAIGRRSIELRCHLLRLPERAAGGLRIAEPKLRCGKADQQGAVRLSKKQGLPSSRRPESMALPHRAMSRAAQSSPRSRYTFR